MARFVVIVLDGFGIGEMPDVPDVRPQDRGANTAKKLISHFNNRTLPNLAKLGLINLISDTSSIMCQNPKANVGRALLAHEGGDTFMGHQEIMGTKPVSPLVLPFKQSIDSIESHLKEYGYKVERIQRKGLSMLYVNQAVFIGDNLEADLGQVYNLCANLNLISFAETKLIGQLVRQVNPVGRNIVFGGEISSNQKIFDSIQVRDNYQGTPTYIGLDTPKTGIYEHGFQVLHLGYGVEEKHQIPYLLNKASINTYLYGKVADVVSNSSGVSYKSIVDTQQLFQLLSADLQKHHSGFFCLNVQETDLAGHRQDPLSYWNTLEKADVGIGQVIEKLSLDDVLLVMADHGNDPFVGHSKHTRERVPLLIYSSRLEGVNLEDRNTLSDVGATIAEFFRAQSPINGLSFLSELFRGNIKGCN